MVMCHRSLDAPQMIESLAEVDIVHVTAGSSHCIALARSGDVYTWGKGRFGRLGLGRLLYSLLFPVLGDIVHVILWHSL